MIEETECDDDDMCDGIHGAKAPGELKMAKTEDRFGGADGWHIGIDEFPKNDENLPAYRVALSEFSPDKEGEFDWWFSDRAAADQAKAVLALHGFTVYGPDHIESENRKEGEEP